MKLRLLVLFVVVRRIGGWGNFHTPAQCCWIAFLNVTKYPPSLSFILLTLGVDLLVLALLSKFSHSLDQQRNSLLTFGKTALFFYVVHMYLYALSGFAFPDGAGLAVVYLVWLMGLALLYLLCRRYRDFKQETAPNSIWRNF